jgi:hypothetical protein
MKLLQTGLGTTARRIVALSMRRITALLLAATVTGIGHSTKAKAGNVGVDGDLDIIVAMELRLAVCR